MENLYEEALEMGFSEEVAEEWALEKFENTPTPYWKKEKNDRL